MFKSRRVELRHIIHKQRHNTCNRWGNKEVTSQTSCHSSSSPGLSQIVSRTQADRSRDSRALQEINNIRWSDSCRSHKQYWVLSLFNSSLSLSSSSRVKRSSPRCKVSLIILSKRRLVKIRSSHCSLNFNNRPSSSSKCPSIFNKEARARVREWADSSSLWDLECSCKEKHQAYRRCSLSSSSSRADR